MKMKNNFKDLRFVIEIKRDWKLASRGERIRWCILQAVQLAVFIAGVRISIYFQNFFFLLAAGALIMTLGFMPWKDRDTKIKKAV